MRGTERRSAARIYLVAMLLGLAPGACGRTGLDAPADVTGAAGAFGQAGTGTAGQSRILGIAGQVGGAGTTGTAGSVGQGGGAGQATAGTGPATCIEGTGSCADARTGQICSGGVVRTFDCPMGCVGGVCAECIPGAAVCDMEKKTLQICGAQGTWQAALPCDGSCVTGMCVECAEGTTRCASHESQQTCKGGQWTPAVDCPFVCVNDACGMDARHVFVTSQTFAGGDLGGLAGADDICRKLAVGAGLSSSYAAWLSDSTGSPATRFPEDVGPYVLVDGTIVANNWTDLTSGTLRHAIDVTETGTFPPRTGAICGLNFYTVWSDTSPDGTSPDASASCDDWTNTEGDQAAILGDAESATLWTQVCRDQGFDLCGATASLYCFEQ